MDMTFRRIVFRPDRKPTTDPDCRTQANLLDHRGEQPELLAPWDLTLLRIDLVNHPEHS
jgi:hypothetical protein